MREMAGGLEAVILLCHHIEVVGYETFSSNLLASFTTLCLINDLRAV